MKKTGSATTAAAIAIHGFRMDVLASPSRVYIPPRSKKQVKRRKLPAGASGTPEELWDQGTEEDEVWIEYAPPAPSPGSLQISPYSYDPNTGIVTVPPPGGTITQW